MQRKKRTGLAILVAVIIFLLLAGTLSAIFIYTSSPSGYPAQDIDIADILSGSNLQLSGSNLEGVQINTLPLDAEALAE